jgi:murein DD-endopeptidase MepM/ murein hydrolase activator NlpD
LAHFGWTRLAYLLFVLSVLMAAAQIGSPSADPWPLASEPEHPPVAEEEAPEPAEISPREDAAHAAFGDHGEGDHRNGATTDAPGTMNPGPPVFYRPALAGSGPACGDLGRFPGSRRIAFPLPKEYLNSYEDTWGAPRPQGGHEGTDLMAPTGTPEYAVTDGTIVPVAGANGNGWNSLGGYAVMLEVAYAVGPVKKGDLFYYAHLDRESTLEIGTRVRAGQVVGYAGDTGQGPEVTRGLFPPHLHLGWYDDAGGARSTVASGAMNPYALLEWIKANGGTITGGSDARYCEAPPNGAPTPSTGEGGWPTPGSPGVSPDLDTGSNDPTPSPAARKNRRIGHADKPATHDEPAPTSDPRDAAANTAPKTAEPRAAKPPSPQFQDPQTPRGEPPTSGAPGEGTRQSPDAPKPAPEEKKKRDQPDEGHNKGRKGEDKREEPGVEPQPADELPSPVEDQYAPETGEPETPKSE